MTQFKTWRFWTWLLYGLPGRRPGLAKYINWWIVAHTVIGVTLACFTTSNLKEASATILLPLASILVGLSFAWAGNAQSLLQTPEIEQLADNNPGGLEDYVYTYQAAILMILITMVLWGMAGLGVFSAESIKSDTAQSAVKFILYFLSSITLRDCWHLVLGGQIMILLRSRINRQNKDH